MSDWTNLYEEERRDIESKLMIALNSIGITGTVTRWNMPSHLPHWQLVIQTSWCADKPHQTVALALEQAMARADIQAPMCAVILGGPPEN